MASSQGGVGAVTALQSHHYSSGPHWSPGVSQYQHQQQPHTARSLDRVLEDAVSSGILNLSGRKLREYPGLSYDLTDTTQAGGSLSPRGSCETTGVNNVKLRDGFARLRARSPRYEWIYLFIFLTRRRHNFRAVRTTQPPTVNVHTHILVVMTVQLLYRTTSFAWCSDAVVRFLPRRLRHMKETTGAPRPGAAPRLRSARCSPFGTRPREKNMNEPESPAADSCSTDLIRAPRSARLNFVFDIRQKMVRTRSLAPFPWVQCDNQAEEENILLLTFSARCGLEYCAQSVGRR